MLTGAAAVLVAVAGFVGTAISRAVPAGMAPANDNAPPYRSRRARRPLFGRNRGYFASLNAF